VATPERQLINPVVSNSELSALQQAVRSFDRDQLLWSSGFLAGLAEQRTPVAPVEEAHGDGWHIFYATETGNSRRIAEQLASDATAAGLTTSVEDLRTVRPKALRDIENAVFVVATHGVGEAPEGSEPFFDFWLSDRAPRLESLKLYVLALGDSSYVDFCEYGRRFDARLRELGATAVVDRIDCDLDFEKPAEVWARQILEKAGNAGTRDHPARHPSHLTAVPTRPVYTRERPFEAEILTRQKITGRESTKDVRHVELDLEGSGLAYQPGDSIGVIPVNPPQLVAALLQATRLDGDAGVEVDRESTSLRNALANDREITILSRPILDRAAVSHPRLRAILESRDEFARYLETHQLIDLVHDFPHDWQPQEFIDALRRLAPRLYSIASSPDANPGEAHLTVAVVNYEAYGRQHWGSASTFLAGDASAASVYVEPNDHFRLPEDGDAPIIMAGAGTGVAPYRAFVEHRREHGNQGNNWLVFGERNFSSDFLYQLEWLRYRKEGLLTNLDVAFSRDQRDKVYVQHRLLENGAGVFDWLEQGAHFYVCGDMKTMAPDVDSALHSIIADHGALSAEKAREYIDDMKRAGRYKRDVY
jgi:sulfite reductase (NADPH) flavoprotein alpha-component